MKPKQDTKTEADKLVRAIKRATRRKGIVNLSQIGLFSNSGQ